MTKEEVLSAVEACCRRGEQTIETQMTKEQVLSAVETYKALPKLITKKFWLVWHIRPEWKDALLDKPYIEEVDADQHTVFVSGSSKACHRRCCGTESHVFEFPTEYLWLTDDEVRTKEEECATLKAQEVAEKDRQLEEQRLIALRKEAVQKTIAEAEKTALRNLLDKYPLEAQEHLQGRQ